MRITKSRAKNIPAVRLTTPTFLLFPLGGLWLAECAHGLRPRRRPPSQKQSGEDDEVARSLPSWSTSMSVISECGRRAQRHRTEGGLRRLEDRSSRLHRRGDGARAGGRKPNAPTAPGPNPPAPHARVCNPPGTATGRRAELYVLPGMGSGGESDIALFHAHGSLARVRRKAPLKLHRICLAL